MFGPNGGQNLDYGGGSLVSILIANALVKRGHDVAANSLFHEEVSELSREEEKKRLDLTTEILTRVCGVTPAGWYGCLVRWITIQPP